MNILSPEEFYVSVLVFMIVFSIGAVVLVIRKHKGKKIESRMLGILEDDPFLGETETAHGFFVVSCENRECCFAWTV